MTVGDLTAHHLGNTFTITVPVGLDGAETYTGPLRRVQHDASMGAPQTLVVVGSWSGPLDPTHPVLEEETDG